LDQALPLLVVVVLFLLESAVVVAVSEDQLWLHPARVQLQLEAQFI